MRFSRNWIAEYTDLPGDRLELSHVLSMLGLVVDDIREAGEDLILDLDLPSNRPDVMNHFEIAREASIGTGAALRIPPAQFAATGQPTAELAEVKIDDPQSCSRFVARAIVDVNVGGSPAWLCDRLEAIGLRPINIIVDVTNFVMWELGRPMHAYDLDKLDGHLLHVRNATPGETVRTLDEVDREVTAEDLVIADSRRVIGLAGLMGGAETGVTEGTRRVLLECACFDAGTVRKMARRHGMHTDASHRFERGMSYQGIDTAVSRACSLIAELAQGTVSAATIDARKSIPDPLTVDMPAEVLRRHLGVDVSPERVVEILTGLQFSVEEDDSVYRATVPARRGDVRLQVDLIEEIARFYGYDKLPATLPLLRRRGGTGLSPQLRDEGRTRRILAAEGYWEAMTFVFTSDEEQQRFAAGEEPAVALANPLSEAMGVLRIRLVPGLLSSLARNLNQGNSRIRLFEIGRTFRPSDDGKAPIERRTVALVACGDSEPRHFASAARPYGFADLRRAIDTLAARMHWPAWDWRAAEVPGLQPGLSAALGYDGVVRGFAGKLDSGTAAQLGIETDAWMAEIDIDELVGREEPPLRVSALPRYPASERDVSLLVSSTVTFRQLSSKIEALEGLPLERFELIDFYQGDDLPEGTHSLTLRLTYRSAERTLTSEEIETAHESVVTALESAFAARRR